MGLLCPRDDSFRPTSHEWMWGLLKHVNGNPKVAVMNSDDTSGDQFPFKFSKERVMGFQERIRSALMDQKVRKGLIIKAGETKASADLIMLLPTKTGGWEATVIDATTGTDVGKKRDQTFKMGFALHCCLGSDLERVHLGCILRHDNKAPATVDVSDVSARVREPKKAFIDPELIAETYEDQMRSYVAKLDKPDKPDKPEKPTQGKEEDRKFIILRPNNFKLSPWTDIIYPAALANVASDSRLSNAVQSV
jgi:hypothetical protein